LTAPAPQAEVDGAVSPVEGSDIPPSMPSTSQRITKRRRKAGPSSEPDATRSRRNTRVRGYCNSRYIVYNIINMA
jgi:hypothetical protein